MNGFVKFRRRLGRFILNAGREKYAPLPFVKDPRMASYISGSTLYMASIDEIRHYSLGIKMSIGPLTIASKTWCKHSSTTQRMKLREALHQYYENVVFHNALDVLAIDKKEAPGLDGIPSWATVLPWSCVQPKQHLLNMKRAIEAENARVVKGVCVTDGSGFWGPVSNKKEEIEVQRLITLLQSVEKNGYIRHDGPDGDIPVTVMIKNNGHWALYLNAGMHRVAVFNAFYPDKEMIVRISGVCHESDVDAWVNVQNGCFKRETALRMFDRFIIGEAHVSIEKWVEKLEIK
jgi:hypothetical protein